MAKATLKVIKCFQIPIEVIIRIFDCFEQYLAFNKNHHFTNHNNDVSTVQLKSKLESAGVVEWSSGVVECSSGVVEEFSEATNLVWFL